MSGSNKSFFARLKAFDAYPKFQDDVKIKTYSGAVVSIIAVIMIVLLFVSELNLFQAIETIDHLFVDTARGEKLKINFDVTFPRIPCPLLSVDVMDVSGSQQLDVDHDIVKIELEPDGTARGNPSKHDLGHGLTRDEVRGPGSETKANPADDPSFCGSCYGAEDVAGQCCNTCEEVKDAYRKKGWIPPVERIEVCLKNGEIQRELQQRLLSGEGCQLVGFLHVNKVAGNFHFAPGKSFQSAHMHVHDLAAFSSGQFNVTHRINRLSYGEEYPGLINPLDGVTKVLEGGGGMFMYYAKVVPTSYFAISGEVIETNQFSVTEHFRSLLKGDHQGLPGVFIFYELSPIMVRFTEVTKPLSHFLTQLCAILGGVFTVAGMLDRLLYAAIRQFEDKWQPNGKLS